MPNWKKVIVSGSDAALNSLNVTSLLSVTGSSNLTGSLDISGSANILGNVGTTTFYTNADTLIFTGSIYISGSIVQTGSLNITSVTSSLFGTASWAENAITSSHAVNALSASYAITASYALNGGSGGGGGVFSFHQTASAVTWSVTHSLNTYTPIIQVYDEAYNQLIPASVSGSSVNTVQLTFATATAGYAVLSTGGNVNINISGSNATLIQSTPATTWSFYHGLNETYPVFTIFDNNDDVIVPLKIHADNANTASIYFSTARTGTAVAANCGLSGSTFESASWAAYAVSSSYAANADLLDGKDSTVFATTGSNIFKGSQTIYGNLFMSGSFPLVYNNDSTNNMLFGMFDGSSIYGPYYQLFGNQYPNIIQRGGAEFVYDIRNNPNADFHIASFNGSTWTTKFVVNDSGSQITGSLGVTGGITGSLFGTASWAQNATTSSYAQTASYADNFTVAGTLTAQKIVVQVITSSTELVTGSLTVSSSLNALGGVTGSLLGTASWAENAITASHAVSALSSSYSLSGSYAVSASYALTASYAENIVVSGAISNVDYIDFDTNVGYTLAEGRLGWDSGEGTLQLGLEGGNVTYSVGNQLFQYVYNAEATTMTKGQVVFVSGSQGNRIAVKYASDAGDPTSAGTLGLVAETITAGGNGWVITEGPLRNLNTLGLTAGSLLFLSSTPGAYTQTVPTAPSHSVRLGYVERVHASAGSIYIKVDNGYEIGELHDIVDTTTTASYGDLLVKSGSVWTNSKQLTGSYGLTGSLNATSITSSLFGTSSWAVSASRAVSALQASTVSVSGVNGNQEYTFVLVLTGSSGASIGLSTDTVTGVIYNPSTNLFRATNMEATGSLFGTSSWANNATSASYALTSSYLNPVTSGYIVLTQVSQSLNYADDAAAAAGGVPLGGLYRNGNFIAIRIV